MTDNGSTCPHTDAPASHEDGALRASSPPLGARRTKAALRSELRRARRVRRSATSPAERRADAISLLVHAEPLLGGVTCVASFEPLATEADVTAINAHVMASARLIVPITLDDLDLSWRDAATGVDLGEAAIAEADVILAPALAIGPHGERLGQGGGCYDRALPRRRDGAMVVAVVHPDEVGRALPVETHDERVDAVLTTDGLTVFSDVLKY